MRRRQFLQSLALTGAALAMPARAGTVSAHDFAFNAIDGGVLRLADYAGRPVMVVNTASRCGFTYQYDGLQALYDRYRERGLMVIGVPSDDFGGQELDTEAEVKEFCAVNFALDFPMAGITRVRGTSAHPFYAWAARTLGPENAPRWNFHKYLVAPDGSLAAAFPTGVEPTAPELAAAVEGFLSQS